MIVVGHVMAVAMDRPVKVLLQPVGMTMLGNHRGMLGNNLENRGDVTGAWRNGPDGKRQAKERHKRSSS